MQSTVIGAGLDRSLRRAILPLLFLGLLLRLFIVISKPQVLWIDDSFYSLGIARNIAMGRGWTHDGIHVTNGFQPLYVFLMVPFYLLLPKDGTTIPVLALLIQSVANTATGFVLFRLIDERIGLRGAFLSLVAWLLSPYVISGINGLETSLQAFLFVSLTYLYLHRWRDALTRQNQSLRVLWFHSLALGALGGLIILARIDSAIIVLLILLDLAVRILLRVRRRDTDLKRLSVVVVAALTTLAIVCFLWFVPSLAHTGRLYFDSGTATRQRSIAEAASANLVLDNLRALVPNLQNRVVTVALPWSAWTQRRYLLLSGALMILFAVFRCTRRRPQPGVLQAIRDLGFLWAYALGLLAVYVGYQFTVWGWPRYFYPLGLILLIILAIWIEVCFGDAEQSVSGRGFGKVQLIRPAYVTLCVGYLLLLPFSVSKDANPIVAHQDDWFTAGQYRAAEWLAHNSTANAKAGAFQSGILSYFSNRVVVNLDGVVNNTALPWFIGHNIATYLVQEQVDYLIDWSVFTTSVDFSQTPVIHPSTLATIRGGNEVAVIQLAPTNPQ